MLLLLLRLLITIGIAFLVGKLVSKIKLPSILGWLISGMLLGPYALSVMNQEVLDAGWYQVLEHILECSVGLMIGTELVWNSGKLVRRRRHLSTCLVGCKLEIEQNYKTVLPIILSHMTGSTVLSL